MTTCRTYVVSTHDRTPLSKKAKKNGEQMVGRGWMHEVSGLNVAHGEDQTYGRPREERRGGWNVKKKTCNIKASMSKNALAAVQQRAATNKKTQVRNLWLFGNNTVEKSLKNMHKRVFFPVVPTVLSKLNPLQRKVASQGEL